MDFARENPNKEPVEEDKSYGKACGRPPDATANIGLLPIFERPGSPAAALVNVYTDGTVLVTHGGVEMGQGLHTKVAQVAASAVNIPLTSVFISDTSTDKVPNAAPTAASVSSDMRSQTVQKEGFSYDLSTEEVEVLDEDCLVDYSGAFPTIKESMINTLIVRFLGRTIGKVIKVDYNTHAGERGKFARLAVMVDLNKPLKFCIVRTCKENCESSTTGKEDAIEIIDNQIQAATLVQPMKHGDPNMEQHGTARVCTGNVPRGRVRLNTWGTFRERYLNITCVPGQEHSTVPMNHFSMWQSEVLDAPFQHGLDNAIEGEKSDDVEEKEWKMINRLTCGTIRSCLSREQKYAFSKETSTSKLWKALEEKFLKKSDKNKLYMKKRLFRFNYVPCTTMTDHIC
ncbi:hypothetical protein F3Y22_tig00110483pilonHSYRG00299 [Hibiscus syriacus]|uniref:Aldehyde oxidase/xanthine dehydrogenase second molybdopterin binding domain-containing protein n=1 Tax=Hibiscus syriacus TaxID=106335 RepID=A0A6A3AF60_HIBSY|nr:hypothetical protein F3Y22_tig00110483pilonHSYRG00299 [Hibiscus syriacus]